MVGYDIQMVKSRPAFKLASAPVQNVDGHLKIVDEVQFYPTTNTRGMLRLAQVHLGRGTL